MGASSDFGRVYFAISDLHYYTPKAYRKAQGTKCPGRNGGTKFPYAVREGPAFPVANIEFKWLVRLNNYKTIKAVFSSQDVIGE